MLCHYVKVLSRRRVYNLFRHLEGEYHTWSEFVIAMVQLTLFSQFSDGSH